MVYLLLVSAAARQLSAAGTIGTKQQYGVLIRTPRGACTAGIIFYICRAAAAQICTLIRPPREACATADLTGWHRADPTTGG